MNTLEADLRARWRPSDAALAAVEAAYAANPGARYVYTGHFLVGKRYGWWTEDVVVEHADEPVARVALTGEDGWEARDLATLDGALLGGERPGTVGWTVHYPDGGWAVFEDIVGVIDHLEIARKEGKL